MPSQGTAGSMNRGGIYSVTGLSDSELRQHLNQQVEVRGRVDGGHGRESSMGSGSVSSTASTGGTATGSTGSTGSAGSTGGQSGSGTSASADTMGGGHAPRLHATSIRMISASCSGGTN
jgi:hypothetical protein